MTISVTTEVRYRVREEGIRVFPKEGEIKDIVMVRWGETGKIKQGEGWRRGISEGIWKETTNIVSNWHLLAKEN